MEREVMLDFAGTSELDEPDGNIRKWSGAQTSKLATPKTINVSRHPSRSRRSVVSGHATVLANPATSVRAVIALRYSFRNARVSVANAGSYNVAAIATPSVAHTMYSVVTSLTRPRRMSETPPSIEPP